MAEVEAQALTFRKYADGQTHAYDDLKEKIFTADHSHKCPTYVHRTPPCQGSCPSGEDVRGWLQIVRGMEPRPKVLSGRNMRFAVQQRQTPFRP